MGVWLKDSTPLMLYATQEFPVSLMALEPKQWLMQVYPSGYIQFHHGLEEVIGTELHRDGKHLELAALGTPVKNLATLSNTDLSKCFVKVDIVEMSMTGK